MKKIMVFCLYGIIICASDYDTKKELVAIKHLERLARVAIKNGLDTLAVSYTCKAQKLAQEAQKSSDTIVQLKVTNEVVPKASL
jgi:hypothetical protein